MQVSVESPSKVEKRLTVTVPFARVDQAFDKQLVQFAKKADIKGFRQGKVPLSYIKERFGKEVREEAINSVINDTLHEAIQQEKLYPISRPYVETKVNPSALEYTATFDILPEVESVDFKVNKLEKLTAVINEKEVDQTVERLSEQHVSWNKVDRAAKEKDKISGKIQMFMEEGKPLTPESMPLEFVLKDEPSIFGWNLKEKLKGKMAGQETKFSHVLPHDSVLQGLGGKSMEFNIEIVEVFEPQLPTLDESFVKKLGVESGDINELRGEIRKQLELNLKRTVKSLLKEQIFTKLIEQNPLDIPNSLIQREAKHLHDENCSHGHSKQPHNHSKEDEAYYAEVAKKRIQLGMLVGNVATKNKITVSQQKMDEYIAELASVYSDGDDYVRRLKADKDKIKEVETFILEEQIVEKLLENVTIVEKEVSYEKLIARGAAEDSSTTHEGA